MIKSYADNFEDVVLWRAFRQGEPGLYIDVGSHDAAPTPASVSLSFQENGWKGVLVACPGRAQPPPEALRANQIAVADDVPLDKVLDGSGANGVGWLRISAAADASKVLDGWRTSKVRPNLILVESDSTSVDPPWQAALQRRGYQRAYHDGRNTYYLHDSCRHLAHRIGLGLGHADAFVLDLVAARRKAFNRDLAAEVVRLRGLLEDRDERISELEEALAGRASEIPADASQREEAIAFLKFRLAAVEASRSWRITAPIRAFGTLARRARQYVNVLLGTEEGVSLPRALVPEAPVRFFLEPDPAVLSAWTELVGPGEARSAA